MARRANLNFSLHGENWPADFAMALCGLRSDWKKRYINIMLFMMDRLKQENTRAAFPRGGSCSPGQRARAVRHKPSDLGLGLVGEDSQSSSSSTWSRSKENQNTASKTKTLNVPWPAVHLVMSALIFAASPDMCGRESLSGLLRSSSPRRTARRGRVPWSLGKCPTGKLLLAARLCM